MTQDKSCAYITSVCEIMCIHIYKITPTATDSLTYSRLQDMIHHNHVATSQQVCLYLAEQNQPYAVLQHCLYQEAECRPNQECRPKPRAQLPLPHPGQDQLGQGFSPHRIVLSARRNALLQGQFLKVYAAVLLHRRKLYLLARATQVRSLDTNSVPRLLSTSVLAGRERLSND
jgi:hypothetical protein